MFNLTATARAASLSRPTQIVTQLYSSTRGSPLLRISKPCLFALQLASRRHACKSAAAGTSSPLRKETNGSDRGQRTRSKNRPPYQSGTSLHFWSSASTWRRAAINTSRCLVGCTSGDFSAMWFLQAFCPEIGMGPIMGIAMASGLTTSMLLETVLLRYGRDGLSWPNAAKTATGMSLISMLTMEAAQNAVDYHLTGGTVAFDSPAFWAAAAVSMGAGFLAPLPYNYHRLRKHGKACH